MYLVTILIAVTECGAGLDRIYCASERSRKVRVEKFMLMV